MDPIWEAECGPKMRCGKRAPQQLGDAICVAFSRPDSGPKKRSNFADRGWPVNQAATGHGEAIQSDPFKEKHEA